MLPVVCVSQSEKDGLCCDEEAFLREAHYKFWSWIAVEKID